MLNCQILTEKLLQIKQNTYLLKMKKIFGSSFFIDRSHFGEDGAPKYLVFQPIIRYFKLIANADYISSWKSKALSAESIRSTTEFHNSTNAKLNYYCNKVRVKFTRSSLKQPYKISYTHSNIVNICIVYE